MIAKRKTVMQRILIVVFSFALLGWGCISALAQSGSLQGFVVDAATGDSLFGADVRLDLPAYPPGYHGLIHTGQGGEFQFDSLLEGVYTVSAAFSEHGFASDAVEITANVTTFVTLRLTGGIGIGESYHTMPLASWVSVQNGFDGVPVYYLDSNRDGVPCYRLVFGPEWYQPGGSAVRPHDGDSVSIRGTLFGYSTPPMLIVREIGGEPWIPPELGHGGAAGLWQVRDSCSTETIVRMEATGWVELLPPSEQPTDSTIYVFHFGADSQRVQLDFGDMTYQPHGDSGGVIDRPQAVQPMHIVAGLLSCPDDSLNHAIVYEMNDQLWRLPGDTTGFGLLELLGSEPRQAPPTSFLTVNIYPNPFNATTTITYTLPSAGSISLTVLDLLGREIAVIHNAYSPAGTHSVSWDGSGHASGLYFCRVTAGADCATRRMLLLK